jgi:acyl-CoA synthetase (AMP-forming)/AMP-acid ligase II
MLLMMLDHPNLSAYDLTSVQNIRFGASSIPPDRIKELRKAFPNAALLHGMGQTESGGTISVLADVFALSKLGSAGTAIPGVAVRLVDDSGNIVPRGTPGEVLAQGPQIMIGYLGRPDATAETLSGGWLHTGDIGIMDDDGMICLVDRKKDMIIRGGENIYSTELEHHFLAHPDVIDCAVIGLPHPLLQEDVGAVIVGPRGPTEAFREALIAHGKQGLASFKVPSHWFSAEALPRTATGKVQKQKLREAALAGELTEL